MKNIIISIIIPLLLTSVVSCNSYFMGKDYEYYEGWARVEDFVVGSEYEIISVDGHPATRLAHGKMVTIAPVAVIPEGEHTMIARLSEYGLDKSNNNVPIRMNISVKKDGRYRLEEINGSPSLVDISDEK